MVHINLIIINNLLISLVGCLHFNIFLCLITTTNLHHLAVPVVASWLHCREQSQSSCLLYQARRLACWRLMGLLKVVTFGFSNGGLQLIGSWHGLRLSQFWRKLVVTTFLHYGFINCMLFLYLFLVYHGEYICFFSPHSLHEVFFLQQYLSEFSDHSIDLSEKKKIPTGL